MTLNAGEPLRLSTPGQACSLQVGQACQVETVGESDRGLVEHLDQPG